MLKSYFITGLRNLLRQKTFSAIKIAGLALGLATSIVIYLYIAEDLSFDQYHGNHDRVVRVLTIDRAEGVSSKNVAITSPALGPAALAELPGVVEQVRLFGGGPYEFTIGDKPVKATAGFRADPSIFRIFDIAVLRGEGVDPLGKPASIVITESFATRAFGAEDPVGKTLKLNQETDLNVTAVIADPPKHSHLQYEVLQTAVPGQNEEGFRQALQNWQSIFARTYLLFDAPPDIDELNTRLNAIARKNNAYEFFTPVVQRLDDIHLRSGDILFDSNFNKGDILNVYVLGSIAGLILLLAAVNFMNLVTANATSRAREIGMRKVIGAVRQQLIYQHLTESVIITLLAAVLALIITAAALPALNNLYQRYADFSILSEPRNAGFLVALVLVVGIASGIYPAFVLSAFRPVQVLKGAFRSSAHGTRLRKILVVLQFTISIALLAGTGIVYQQMNFIRKTDLGYNRDQVITLQQTGRAIGRAATLKTELLRNSNVVAAGTSSSRLGQQPGRTQIYPEGFSTTESNIITSVMSADEAFIPAMEMKIVAGRNFTGLQGDSLSMIVNEELLRLLKWDAETAPGRKISLQTGPDPADLTAYTIVGVVRDFHFATIRHKLEPIFIVYNAANPALSIRIKATDAAMTIGFIEETWKKVNPGTTFEYGFLDEQFAALYRNEAAFSTMFTHFTVLAIVIAAIGLFALSAFTAEQRKKEIGIRKVLGATNATIFYRLSSEYLLLIVIAFPVATALSYFVMKEWLKDFQYAVGMSPAVFIGAGVLALVVCLVTVSFQAIRAALGNPVNALRNE